MSCSWRPISFHELDWKFHLLKFTCNPYNLSFLFCCCCCTLSLRQVKVQGQNEEMLLAACEQFLGKDSSQIRRVALETLEGHQRAIMGSMTVEVFHCNFSLISISFRKSAGLVLLRNYRHLTADCSQDLIFLKSWHPQEIFSKHLNSFWIH